MGEREEGSKTGEDGKAAGNKGNAILTSSGGVYLHCEHLCFELLWHVVYVCKARGICPTNPKRLAGLVHSAITTKMLQTRWIL